jgi:hypothetical protein
MAESTLDGITTSSWTLSAGFVDEDGVYVLNRGGTLTANDAVFTTLDDGDLVTDGSVAMAVTPDGGAPSSHDPQYPTTEDVPVDVQWTPDSNGLYSVYVFATTDGGQGPVESTAITVKVRGWTEAEAPADTSTELSRTADVSTEGNKAADATTERIQEG